MDQPAAKQSFIPTDDLYPDTRRFVPPAIYFVLDWYFSLMNAVLPPYTRKDQVRCDRVKVLSRMTATLEGRKNRVAQLGPGRNIPISTQNGSRRARPGSARSFHVDVSPDVTSSTGRLPSAAAGPHPDQ